LSFQRFRAKTVTMNTHIVSGSHRLNSQSMKVANYVKKQIEAAGGKAKMTDLSRNALPLWDETVWEGNPDWKKIWDPIAAELKAADSLIIIVPEYHGMAGPAMKNFFLFCSPDLVGHKPGLLMAVSAGTGGAYPIAEMRASSYKNCRLNYIPDHVIVRDATKVLNDETAIAGTSDEFIRNRIKYSLSTLNEYEKALKGVRESGVINHKDYANGM
jgi:azobenzene reductase